MSYLSKVTFSFEDGTTKVIADSDLVEFVCSENLTDTNVTITPGLCEQYADIKLYDRGNYFHLKAMDNGLDNAQVTVQLKDLSNDTIIELGSYIVNKWDIEGDNSVITAHCKDLSFLLEYIVIPESDIEDRTITNLLDIIFNALPDLSYEFFDTATRNRCNNITIPDSWYRQTDLLTMLKNLCYVGMLRMLYKNGVFLIARSI